MIQATVNGEPVELVDGTTVATLLAARGVPSQGVAVAVDREVVPRSGWAIRVVTEGARVEIVTAAAGG